MEILSVEKKKPGFDKRPINEIEKMVGFIDVPDKGTWDVTMEDGSIFACSNQETAQLMASTEEIKAMLELADLPVTGQTK